MKKYRAVIGLEVHLQVLTSRKIFCNCKNNFGDEPNTNICPICTGQPGVLPVFNKDVLKKAIILSHALNCKINPFTRFDRKNYFYPDCPKNYQITQFDYPIGYNGDFYYYSEKKDYHIGIIRIHMEEDSAKMIHEGDSLKGGSIIDYNRSGIPLLEIVTKPGFEDAESAVAYLEFLKRTAKFLNISNCNMEEGSLRVDTNISVTEDPNKLPDYKVEIKNLNSFNAVKNALEHEYNRQINILEKGGTIHDETRTWSEKEKITKLMRSKETESDYRYFPEPDIPPLLLDEKTIYSLKEKAINTPYFLMNNLINNYKISVKEAYQLTSEKEIYDYFIKVSKLSPHYKKVINWILGDLIFNMRKLNISFNNLKLKPETLALIVEKIEKKELTGKIVKEIFPDLLDGEELEKIIKKRGLKVIANSEELEKIIDNVLETHPKEVSIYKGGKTNIIGFFMGQIMKKTRGQADPVKVKELLEKKLKN